MRRAIDAARAGIARGQTPFGACIVSADGGEIVSAHNVVWETTDITAHAEVTAIRRACAKLGAIDLSGCAIYSTCEPCPMCFSACHWARIARIVYGASIDDARAAGFNELAISNEQMKRLGGSGVSVAAGVLREETAALFEEWLMHGGGRGY
jgi:tRNA(Arg) A34 adenosine deaminase TadA